ncbi:MAG: hypothetical protein ABIO68_01095 [Sphingomicrobium sp.]
MAVRMVFAALLFGAAAAPAGAQPAPTAQGLVERNLEARGGAAALAAIQTVSFEGRTLFPGDFEVGYREARSMIGGEAAARVDFTLQGLDIIQAYDGHSGWRINPLQGRKDAERMSADEARAVADASSIEGPLLASRGDGSPVAYLGREDFDGTLAYKLKVSQKDGDEFTYWLDPDTFLEIKIAETRRIRGAQQTTESELGDYEKVAGVYFPMSVESWSQGHSNQRQRVIIAKSSANSLLAANFFTEPKGSAGAVKAGDGAPTANKPVSQPGDTQPAEDPSPTNPPKGI